MTECHSASFWVNLNKGELENVALWGRCNRPGVWGSLLRAKLRSETRGNPGSGRRWYRIHQNTSAVTASSARLPPSAAPALLSHIHPEQSPQASLSNRAMLFAFGCRLQVPLPDVNPGAARSRLHGWRDPSRGPQKPKTSRVSRRDHRDLHQPVPWIEARRICMPCNVPGPRKTPSPCSVPVAVEVWSGDK
jgi:hypothetical protein